MAKKKLTSYVSEDADNPVMQFLNNAAEAENFEEETEIRKRAKETIIRLRLQVIINFYLCRSKVVFLCHFGPKK